MYYQKLHDAHVNALWDHFLATNHSEHCEDYLLHQARMNCPF